MKISPVTNAYRRNLKPQKQINFGIFLDKNAKDTVEKALAENPYTKERNQLHMWLMGKEDYIVIYTDTDGIVKGKFRNTLPDTKEGKDAQFSVDLFIKEDSEALKDLSIRSNAVDLGLRLNTISLKLMGYKRPESTLSDELAAARAARDEARINHLIW